MRFRPALIAATTVFGLMAIPVAARADSVPFSDPSVKGYLGFCDSSNHAITSGSLSTHPFVAKVVSSLAAPDAYAPAKGGKATLYAYQPRQELDPGEWSNAQITGSSHFSDQQHPMSEGTTLDFSMGDMVTSYPPKWDDLLQLRLLLTAPGMQMLMQPYAATVIRIVGDRWEMVNPQTLPCDSGSARSFEHDFLPASTFSPKPSAAPQATGISSSVPSGSSTLGRGNHPSSASAMPSGVSSPSAAGVQSQSTRPTAARVSSGHGTAVWITLLLAGLAALGGGGLWWQRSHRT